MVHCCFTVTNTNTIHLYLTILPRTRSTTRNFYFISRGTTARDAQRHTRVLDDRHQPQFPITAMFRKPFASFNPRRSGAFHQRRLLTRSLTFGPCLAVPLGIHDRRRLTKAVAKEFSISPDTAESLVPEVLFSLKFESHSDVPGVSLRSSITD